MLLKFLHVHITFCSSWEWWKCVHQTRNTVLLRGTITHWHSTSSKGKERRMPLASLVLPFSSEHGQSKYNQVNTKCLLNVRKDNGELARIQSTGKQILIRNIETRLPLGWLEHQWQCFPFPSANRKHGEKRLGCLRKSSAPAEWAPSPMEMHSQASGTLSTWELEEAGELRVSPCVLLNELEASLGYMRFGLKQSFLAHNASAKSTICWLIECLIYHDGIPHSIASVQELTSQPNKCDSGPTIKESTSLTVFPTILKQFAWQKDWMSFGRHSNSTN